MPAPDPAPDPEIARLLDALRRSVDGDAWHGPALADALDGLDARAAATRPIPGAHTIWELVLHLTAWMHEVARRLDGAAPGDPAEGDWPAPPMRADDEHWRDSRRRLDEARTALLDTVARLDPARLDTPLRASHTVASTLAGVAEHHAYHGGQIVLLRKAIDGQ